MAVGYKYVKREAGSQINWAEVGKNMSDMLLEERDIREKRKADIDAATREFQTILDNSPESEHKGMAEFTLDFTSNMQKAYIMQDKLLKSGGLSLRDYTIQRQNMVEGVNNAFNLIKNYNADFLVAKEKLDAGQLSAFSTQMMERVESFGQITNSKIFINPTDFKLSIAKTYTDENGVEHMSDDPNEHATVDSLKVRTTQLIDVFDVKGALAEDVSYLASVYQEALNSGAIRTIDDLRRNPKFDESMRDTIESVLTNQMNAASILADNSVDKILYDENGNEISREEINWEFTEDPEEAASDVRFILVETNPDGSQTPKLTEEQMNIAGDWVDTQLEMMIQKKEEARQEFAKSSRGGGSTSSRAAENDRRDNIARINNTQDIVAGNESAFKSAVDTAIETYEGPRGVIEEIKRDSNGIVVVFEDADGVKKELPPIKYTTDDGLPRTTEDILKELYSKLYPTEAQFDTALNDFQRNNALTPFDDFVVFEDEKSRKRTASETREVRPLSVNQLKDPDTTWEEWVESDDGLGDDQKVTDAASVVETILDGTIPRGTAWTLHTPTKEEVAELLVEFSDQLNRSSANAGVTAEDVASDWMGTGWIDAYGSTDLVVFKVGQNIHAVPWNDDPKKLWRDMVRIVNDYRGGELDN